VVGVGVVLPLVWQAAELSHKVAHTVVPAVLVLVGGFTLRWIMVNAGQMSEIVPVLGMAP
jgi:formate-dependent nitrite reductase membrane component NrfD